MIPTPATLLAAAWRTFRRDREALLALAGVFAFLPAFAVMLGGDPVPPLPAAPRDEAAMSAWMQALMMWGRGNAHWHLLADVVGLYGLAAMAVLLGAADRPTVGEALRRAGSRIWAFVGLGLLVAVPVGLGLWLFVLPGLYAQARLSVALPLLARTPDAGIGAAIRGSMARTRGKGLAITGALVGAFLMQWLVAVPLLSADDWLRAPGNGNALLLALVDAGIAAAGAAWNVAVLLVGVAVYRASRGT